MKLFIAALQFANALYSSSDAVIQLGENNFASRVTESKAVWIVEFYSPNCGHCVSFAPEYKEAAKVLKGIANVAAVDATQNQNLAGKYKIRGFPTVLIFSADKSSPVDYQGQRTAKSLASTALDHIKKVVNQRLGIDQKTSGGSASGSVIELTDSNFAEKVLKSDEAWLVGFFAPWCGHCQRLKPDYEAAARQLGKKAKLGAVDATVHQALAQKYNVQGFPTLFFFGGDKSNPELYEAGRSSSDIVRYMEEKATATLPAPKAQELLSQSQLNECNDRQLCIVAALPDLLDCQSKCRNDYIKMIEAAGDKHKAKGWLYFWMPALKQPEVERTLNLGGFGYPALVAMNVKKQKYAPMRGSFSAEGIHEFLRDVSLGSRSIALQNLDRLPTVTKAEAWDGKDAELPEVEEVDLDSLKMEL